MNPTIQSENEVRNVSDFIRAIQERINTHVDDKVQFLYRGECKVFSKSCRAGIFRKGVLATNSYYEKGMLNTMRQNHLSESNSYLENAIDAQHGSFPSRLLDVSYNCLAALYFAVTPYHKYDITLYDSEDGMVYIFYIDEIFSPNGENTNDTYNAIINKNVPWFNSSAIFGKKHKFIDHTKINHRIIAQQGAFILFQGNDDEAIPQYMVDKIRIPKEAKSTIRNELLYMFGIHTGSIYPEVDHIADELVIKSKKMINEPFCPSNEIKYVLRNLKKEVAYYYQDLLTYNRSEESNADYYERVQAIEKLINSYREGLIDFLNAYHTEPDMKENFNTLEVVKQYNEIISPIISDFDLSKSLAIQQKGEDK